METYYSWLKSRKIIRCAVMTILSLMWVAVAYAQTQAMPPQAVPQNSVPAESLVHDGGGAVPPPSTVSASPQTTSPAATAVIQPSSLSEQLSKKTGCKPQGDLKCELTVTAPSDFAVYLLQCQQLQGWLVHYAQSSWLSFTIIGGGVSTGCQILAEDKHIPDQPKSVTCVLTDEQLKASASGNAMEAIKQYDVNKQVNDVLLKIGQPLLDCIKPIGQFKEIKMNNNVKIK